MAHPKTGILAGLAAVALLLGCGATRETPPPGAEAASARDEIRIVFDYSAAEALAAAVGRASLSESEARALLRNRGVAAMVAKTGVFVPGATADGFVRDLRLLVEGGASPRSPFSVVLVRDRRAGIESLVATLRADEEAIKRRMIARLGRYAPDSGPGAATVYFVAGGVSDGFVLDDDPEPAFFVALDRASGDADGVEQNMTHELYHVLQKASAARSPGAARFLAGLPGQPPLQQLLATTLWEGTANFAADARETQGEGPYVSMWRGRYLRNHEPARMRENFARFDSVVAGLAAGRIDWQTAYRRGFSGSDDSRFYFVGMEMARALASAHGADYFDDLFTRPPAGFFRDYLALSERDPSLPRFSAATRATIEALPAAW